MSYLKITAERFSIRCEICHQRDSFDAKTNYCNRCKNIEKTVLKMDALNKRINTKSKWNHYFHPQTPLCGIIGGFIGGSIISFGILLLLFLLVVLCAETDEFVSWKLLYRLGITLLISTVIFGILGSITGFLYGFIIKTRNLHQKKSFAK